jgi:LacI family transcriptional regulator
MNPPPTSDNIPTMRDLARLSGVGLSTVSYALNDGSHVSERTKRRILKIAAEIGYKKNPVVGSLMKQVRRGKLPRYQETIGFITAFDTKLDWRKGGFIRTQYENARKVANSNGYVLEDYWLKEPDMTPARLGKILRNRGIRGLLIAPLPTAGTFEGFPWEHFYCMGIGYSLQTPAVHRAVVNVIQSTELALNKLHELGYKRPMFIMTRGIDDKTAHRFTIGWNYYYKAIFRRTPENLIYTSLLNIETKLPTLVKQHSPDVIMAFTNTIRLLESAGLRVPEDIGCIHMNQNGDPKIAGINQNWDHIASIGASYLISHLQGIWKPGIPEIPTILQSPGVWVDGPSLRQQK